ncbi:BZ3500_MvSof-1268-A1-R1_Chr3-2g06285 [Microbotryum saponariae]|uniref:BZ3500_MvSof-1268-A1-R1_Chr3-2g06285 protein n=1 Tax=Microbotryum saponariae TaxID=289078 RepID=A0A2X0NFS2_9BASI|nr:BZ3500_MvSof-1268-A1-R1_Chr3-2g06285 [Microbotryum saponariae]SDA04256.1 BZ3501_MvSof-1269-A2-R1_Chr3-2g05976 [Microbotryum saponariae]
MSQSTLKKKERRQPQRAQLGPNGLGGVPLDMDYVSRRIKRHLNDLERTNYTEPTTGPTAYGASDAPDEDGTEKGVTPLRDDDSALDIQRSGGSARRKVGRDKSGRKKRSMAVRSLLMYRKNLATLVDESRLNSSSLLPPAQGLSKLAPTTPSYLTASAPPSKRPPLQLCSVCGYKGTYGCMRCGQKYCDMGCRAIHDESRCEKR